MKNKPNTPEIPESDGRYYYKTEDGKGWLGRFTEPITEEGYIRITLAEWDAHIAEMEAQAEAERQAAEAARQAAEAEYNKPANVAKREKEARIAFLKGELARTDYQAIKFAEGWIDAEEYADMKAQRQEWRDEINQLEAELA